MPQAAAAILDKLHYNKRLKTRDMEETIASVAPHISPERDPKIKFMKACEESKDRVLPIFDKIYNKTLCLQNYQIADGHCKGLAEACEFLDYTQVNRILLNNCGISGEQLATILEGANKMKDFKALILKQTPLTFDSIERLRPIIDKTVPFHLEEI